MNTRKMHTGVTYFSEKTMREIYRGVRALWPSGVS